MDSLNVPKDWLKKRKKDYYYRLAKKEMYRSRAAYKLLQLNEKFSVIKKGDVVVDLGCAPGGWSQLALELVGVKGKVVGVDLKNIKPIENLIFIRGDLTKDETLQMILEAVEKADVIISDMSPRISGHKSYDQARFLDLCENALNLGEKLLKHKGNLVVKMFQGELLNEFLAKVKERFRYVKLHRSKASISKSSEVFVVAKGFTSQRAR